MFIFYTWGERDYICLIPFFLDLFTGFFLYLKIVSVDSHFVGDTEAALKIQCVHIFESYFQGLRTDLKCSEMIVLPWFSAPFLSPV